MRLEADVARLRADLATVTKERDDAFADYLKAAKDRTEYHDALAEVRAEIEKLTPAEREACWAAIQHDLDELDRVRRELAEARAEIAAVSQVLFQSGGSRAGLLLIDRATELVVQRQADAERCEWWAKEVARLTAERDDPEARSRSVVKRVTAQSAGRVADLERELTEARERLALEKAEHEAERRRLSSKLAEAHAETERLRGLIRAALRAVGQNRAGLALTALNDALAPIGNAPARDTTA